MNPTIPLSNAPALLASKAQGGRVFIPGGPVEPLALARAFGGNPDHAASLTFVGMMIPGMNVTDWAALHPTAQAEVFLPSPDLAATIQSGQTKVLPLHYSAAYRYLCSAPFKAAVFHVCPPDRDGNCNLSLSADSSAAFLDCDVFKLGIINHALPRILGAPAIPVTAFDALVETDEPPIAITAATPSSDASAIATHVAALVEDGATLQTGIGKLPGAVMAALAGHRDLKLHSGLIGEWALDLMHSGAFNTAEKALTAGVILGSPALHEALCNDSRVSLVPIDQTHSAARLATIDRFTSINAALEIDLFGQINCEYAGSRTIAGIGGALDFLRGARASKGGKPIIMIASEGKGGVSRIVPRLTTPTISVSRADPPILVTEHGSIDLEPLDAQARAHAIIALAAPSHRDMLTKAWQDMTS
jgi:acyl-CoA hydrolase